MAKESIKDLPTTWDPVEHIEKMDIEPALKKLLIKLTDPEFQEQIFHTYGELARISGDPEIIEKHQAMLTQRAKDKAKREARLKKLEREMEIQKAVWAKMEEEVRLHEAHKHEGRIPLTAKEIRQSVLESFNKKRYQNA